MNEILKFLIGSISISSLLYFLTKEIITKFLNGSIESYKHKLDKKLESHKIELNKILDTHRFELKKMELEYNTKISSLYIKRAQIIENLYLELINLNASIFNVVKRNQGPNWAVEIENFGNASKNLENFNANFKKSKIYLNSNLSLKIEKTLDLSFDILTEMQSAKESANSGYKEDYLEAKTTWKNQALRFKDELLEYEKELCDEFRQILGVE